MTTLYIFRLSLHGSFYGIMNEYNYFTVDVNDDMINVIHTTMVACQMPQCIDRFVFAMITHCQIVQHMSCVVLRLIVLTCNVWFAFSYSWVVGVTWIMLLLHTVTVCMHNTFTVRVIY